MVAIAKRTPEIFWARSIRPALFACMAGCFLAACVSGPRRPDASEYPRTPSHAIAQSEQTALRDALAPFVRAHPGQSGFMLLPNGEDSLRLRLALVTSAEKTLDLQYYAMHDDGAAGLMLEALLRAAERGVRIRFLIDNISFRDVEQSLALLEENPNVSVRVFNPIATKEQGFFAALNGLIVNLEKASKRMHNKALISDNQLSIIGGRNIGDEYFDARPDVNFEDMDLLSAGPITARISESFDKYWNSEEAFPIAALRDRPARKDLARYRADIREIWDTHMKTPEGARILRGDLADLVRDGRIKLVWARAEMTADDPEKVSTDTAEATSKPMRKLDYLLRDAKEEFIAITPYFVPREDGLAWLQGLRQRGLNVRILTNSLAATDVVAVHTGYRRYREDVLKAGIELYEFKPVGGQRPRQRLFGSSAPAQASLHSKVYIIDGKDLIVGSYNLDPRSAELNTEIAVVIHSRELAAQARAIFKQSIAPRQSHTLEMTPKGLRWHSEDEDGEKETFRREPGAGIVRNVQTWLFSFLPLENQL